MEPIELLDGRVSGLRWRGGDVPVLALHGWLDNAHSFLPLSEHLGGLDLVAVDFPGHGLSAPRPDGVRYHFDDYSFDVLAVLDDLGWQRANLLGHSLGGAVSTLVAAAAPERVNSMALIEGLGPLSAPAEKTAEGWRKAVARSRPRNRRVHAGRHDAVAARQQGSDLSEASTRLLAERGLVEADGGWQWRHDQRLTWPTAHRYTEPQVIDLLAHIEAPVLNVHSDPGTGLMNQRMFQLRLAALQHRRETVSCPGGHHLHMLYPERIAPNILEHFHDAA
ncbi:MULTISPECIES: alpha/beta hydrolase [unclassified Wenzhouxiangella]|uniref:alpha/beta hydrolase n=1 Tax=unclassified Wenzhouxiangella TaxID=2613841 RepID=UPI0015F29FD6|nr:MULTISPECIES: alpha/beta hydrolase [unclassified Wenzhouxiangella]